MTDTSADAPFEPHTIELTIDRRHGFSHTFRCVAPKGSPCRLVCPEGCEEVSLSTHPQDALEPHDYEIAQRLIPEARERILREHTLVDSGECNLLLFLESDEAELWELYDGEPTGARSGHVALTYDGDAVTWHYLPHPIDDPARAEIEARDKERADA